MNEYLKYISVDPNIRFGKTCIKGTRITVSDILGWLAAGMSQDEITTDFPSISKDHILAALAFAANRDQITRISSA